MNLVFATQNQNKVREISSILPPDLNILSLIDINCLEDIPETSDTIKGNAIQKAEYVYKNFGINCFADDTGLEVDALDGEPGVYSARYSGPEKNSLNNLNLLLKNLQDIENRKAQFKTVIALTINGKISTYEGIAEGEIIKSPRGEFGFGYDPIFKPNGYNKTFAELTSIEKNKISHRAKAIRKMKDFLKENF